MVPLFLIVVFTILEASLWIHASSVAQAAAQDGARAGTALSADVEEGERAAVAILDHRHVGKEWEVVAVVDGDILTVTVTGKALSIIPGLDIAVRESAALPWEGP